MSLLTFTKPITLGLAALSITFNAYAAVSQEQWRALNLSVVNGHIMPAYHALAEQSTALAQTTQQLCQAPDAANLDRTKAQYLSTLAAWQAAQHITFGPIELLMRSYSIQFWPDKKNLTSKQLKQILSAEDRSSLSEEAFQTASIAVKGLPAMERILYAKDALTQLESSPFRCEFLHAVSTYIQKQTRDTYTEWQSFKEEFSHTGSEDGLYESAEEGSVDLFKAQIEPLEIIRDLKILRPLASQKAKPRRLESWRSEHSLQNLQRNIQSLHHMYSGVSGLNLKQLLESQDAKALATQIETQFINIETLLDQIPSPLHLHIKTETVRNQLLELAEQIEQLGKHFTQAMQLLDIQLGFNSRDGD